jgi:hypothetical protein
LHPYNTAVVAAISPKYPRGKGGPSDPVLMAAWQAAPGVPPDENGKQRFAVEGLGRQTLLYSTSHDSGETWAEPAAVPVRHVMDDNYRAGERPAWGPVLHYDKRSNNVFLFYSLSRECNRPTEPKTWEPGGDVRIIVVGHTVQVEPTGLTALAFSARNDNMMNRFLKPCLQCQPASLHPGREPGGAGCVPAQVGPPRHAAARGHRWRAQGGVLGGAASCCTPRGLKAARLVV